MKVTKERSIDEEWDFFVDRIVKAPNPPTQESMLAMAYYFGIAMMRHKFNVALELMATDPNPDAMPNKLEAIDKELEAFRTKQAGIHDKPHIFGNGGSTT